MILSFTGGRSHSWTLSCSCTWTALALPQKETAVHEQVNVDEDGYVYRCRRKSGRISRFDRDRQMLQIHP